MDERTTVRQVRERIRISKQNKHTNKDYNNLSVHTIYWKVNSKKAEKLEEEQL